MNLNELDSFSILSLYSAVALYTFAFICFALDLARRSSTASAAERAERGSSGAEAGATVASGAASTAGGIASVAGGVGVIASARVKTTIGAGEGSASASIDYGRSPLLRIATALTVIGWLLHVSAVVLRGVAAGRVPWANMYEFSMTGTLMIVSVFLLTSLLFKQDLRFLGTFITGLVLVLLMGAGLNFYVSVVPLPPALQSIWLIVHVVVAALATGFFALGFALSITQLFQFKREGLVAAGKQSKVRLLATLPSAEKLEALAYRMNIVGFIMWTFTLMAGSVWAEKAWGRYWGWDTKEVWTFIIWVIFAGYIHARATRGWRGKPSAWLSIIGFSAVLFNFTIVNLFFKGLHAYSGL